MAVTMPLGWRSHKRVVRSREDAVVPIFCAGWQDDDVASEAQQPKLQQGTSQHTLLARRIKALYIASALIQRELDARSKAP